MGLRKRKRQTIPEFELARPVTIQDGTRVSVEVDRTSHYLREWASVLIENGKDSTVELMVPLDEALKTGLIRSKNEPDPAIE